MTPIGCCSDGGFAVGGGVLDAPRQGEVTPPYVLFVRGGLPSGRRGGVKTPPYKAILKGAAATQACGPGMPSPFRCGGNLRGITLPASFPTFPRTAASSRP